MSWFSFALLLLCWWPLTFAIALGVGARRARAADSSAYAAYAFDVTEQAPNLFRLLAIGAWLGVVRATELLCLPLHPLYTLAGVAVALVAVPTFGLDALLAMAAVYQDLTGRPLPGRRLLDRCVTTPLYLLASFASVLMAPWLSVAALLRAS